MMSRPSPSAVQQKFSKAALTALACGLCVFVPFATGLAALVAGPIGIRATRSEAVVGRRWAILGMALGLVNLGAWGFIVDMHLERAPIEAVAHQYIDDLAHHRLAAARQESLANRTDAVQVDADTINNHGTVNDIEVGDIHRHSGYDITTASIDGLIGFTNNAQTFTFQMVLVRFGGQWRVQSFIAYPH